ncbi:MAG: pyruvate dehydrogenase complex dihydrolipoamide acetyltransferase [Myxococcaceae bacterium]|nr:pyruvate dehydrogenase complex dihydrolipoamide acetyltransferase [Myxococcaceae bacterium]
MAIAVELPALSPTMKEGKITKWLKKEGDKVTSGTAIAEVETDKSNLEIEAYDDGVLLKILVPEGSSAPVGSPIAYIGKAGEKFDEAAAPAKPKAAEPAKTEEKKGDEPAPKAEEKKAEAPKAEAPAKAESPDGRLRASPLAKRIAAETGVDLSSVSGSGPNGRIVKRDVEQAKPGQSGGGAAVKSKAPVPTITRGERKKPDTLPISGMRKVIAQRLTEVKPGVPHFYLTVDLEMDQALKLREEAKALEQKVSVNDIVVKAVAMAVRRFPRINQQMDGEKLLQLHNVDVGVAVAIEDGLITPVVRDADQKGLAEIGAEVRELADRAKKKALKPDEYSGGSITVSNLGMYGIDEFIAVLNPPQAAILAIGAVTPKAVVRDGQIVIRNMMTATLSGDHRVIDGAVGAEYLKELRSLLEHPLRLLF